MEKIANESISAILFRTTPKVDLPHYLFIFSYIYPLGIELNNEEFSRLVTMLYLEIQNGKEAMKSS